jgi:hypothetical protein
MPSEDCSFTFESEEVGLAFDELCTIDLCFASKKLSEMTEGRRRDTSR